MEGGRGDGVCGTVGGAGGSKRSMAKLVLGDESTRVKCVKLAVSDPTPVLHSLRPEL